MTAKVKTEFQHKVIYWVRSSIAPRTSARRDYNLPVPKEFLIAESWCRKKFGLPGEVWATDHQVWTQVKEGTEERKHCWVITFAEEKDKLLMLLSI